MKQFGTQKFESQCKKAHTFVENDMSVCALYDYAMELKAYAFKIIEDAQKKEEEEKKSKESPCEVVSA
jgi:hypothetical protein